MKENYSLSLSQAITEKLREDLSGAFYNIFPFDKLSAFKSDKERNRVYTTENTLLTMISTMVQEDKSLQNSVNIYSIMHKNNIDRITEEQSNTTEMPIRRQRGRPRKQNGRIAKSKLKEISKDTSGFSQARQRLPQSLVRHVFELSRTISDSSYPNKWHDYRVFITDGTYLQMQDTEAIKEQYPQQQSGVYPRGLLQVILEQGSGVVYDCNLGNDKKSELETLSNMISNIPSKSLILADDLYNCFAIFAKLKKREIEIIVPGKRVRKYSIIRKLGNGDEIVEIKQSKESKWMRGEAIDYKSLTMRRIEYKNPYNESQKFVLYTSLIDESIGKEEIILKYESRWDIEISIREIKTILDMNIIRAKTPEMAYKELLTGLIAYNYIRRLILESTTNEDFSPEADIIQKYYTFDKPIYVDKLGRKYSRWSPGRNTKADIGDSEAVDTQSPG